MGSEFKTKILIDTDFGDDVDDAAALIMALNSPELEIVGITTVFQDTKKRAEMVLELCQMYGRSDIPVYAGKSVALIEKTDSEEPPIQYGILKSYHSEKIKDNILAAQFMIQMAEKYEDLVIVEMGMMTNLAIAFILNPEIMKHVRIVGMGGNFTEAIPEWNILCDPEAARIVMDNSNYLELFGLEITKHCLISRQQLESHCQNDRLNYYLKGVHMFQEKLGYNIKFHDVTLITYLIAPEIARMEKCNYTVELSGEYTRASIVKLVDPYEIDSLTDRDFYYAREFDFDLFFKLVNERLN